MKCVPSIKNTAVACLGYSNDAQICNPNHQERQRNRADENVMSPGKSRYPDLGKYFLFIVSGFNLKFNVTNNIKGIPLQ